MPRIFKITVNGTEYDVAVEELTDGATQIMPRYTPAPVAAASAAPVAVAAPKAKAAAPAATAQPTNVMAAVSGGKHVYETFCAACHSGGDETAPELSTLI